MACCRCDILTSHDEDRYCSIHDTCNADLCNSCLYSCYHEFCTPNERCSYKGGHIAGSVLFFVNMMIGIFVLIVYSKLPRDPCCYPGLLPYPSYQIQHQQMQLSQQVVQLPNGQLQVVQVPQATTVITSAPEVDDKLEAPPSYNDIQAKDKSTDWFINKKSLLQVISMTVPHLRAKPTMQKKSVGLWKSENYG